MQSLRSRILNFAMRNRHLLEGRLHREAFNAETSIPAFRAQCEKSAARLAKLPPGVTVEPGTIDDMRCEWLVPSGARRDRGVLYVHGGGYVSGSCADHRGFVAKLAARTGLATLTYEYRLAPEHPFPAAVDDSIAAYRWLLATGLSPDHILVAGESAGGGLALALLLALKEAGLPLPCGAVAISPWTDLTCSGESYRTKGKVSVAPAESWTVFSRHYVADNDPSNPLISPLFGDLAGLPPLLINSAVDDELFDDGESFASKARACGVEVTFRRGVGMVHCYPLLAPMFPEATQAMDEIVAFMRARLK